MVSRPESDIVINRFIKGLGFCQTMPIFWRSLITSVPEALMSTPSIQMLPLVVDPDISSFIRFSDRRKVDLPQPEGPISAVTDFSGKAG